MELADEAGYFAALIPGKKIGDYTLKVDYPDGRHEEIIDPYRFGPVITKKIRLFLLREPIMRPIKYWEPIYAVWKG